MVGKRYRKKDQNYPFKKSKFESQAIETMVKKCAVFKCYASAVSGKLSTIENLLQTALKDFSDEEFQRELLKNALIGGNLEVVEFVLSKFQADLNQKDKDNLLPIQYTNSPEIKKSLLKLMNWQRRKLFLFTYKAKKVKLNLNLARKLVQDFL